MSNFAKGRGVRVEVALTYASPKTITEVTAASPGVASCTGHGLAAKTIGYFATATGMPALEGQACRVAASPGTDSFSLEGLDTSTFGDFFAGSFVPVATWGLLGNTLDYQKSGGDLQAQDVSVIVDEIMQQEAGMLGAETVAINGRLENTKSAASAFVDAAAISGDFVIMRITLKTGDVRYWRGQVGRPSEGLATNAIGTTAFNTSVKGRFMSAAA